MEQLDIITLGIPEDNAVASPSESNTPKNKKPMKRKDSFLVEYTERVGGAGAQGRTRTPTLPGMMEMLAETTALREANDAVSDENIRLSTVADAAKAEAAILRDTVAAMEANVLNYTIAEERRLRAALEDGFRSTLVLILESQFITQTYRRRSSVGAISNGHMHFENILKTEMEAVVVHAQNVQNDAVFNKHRSEVAELEATISRLETQLVQESSKQYRYAAAQKQQQRHVEDLSLELTETSADLFHLQKQYKVVTSELAHIRSAILLQQQKAVDGARDTAPPPLFALRKKMYKKPHQKKKEDLQ